MPGNRSNMNAASCNDPMSTTGDERNCSKTGNHRRDESVLYGTVHELVHKYIGLNQNRLLRYTNIQGIGEQADIHD